MAQRDVNVHPGDIGGRRRGARAPITSIDALVAAIAPQDHFHQLFQHLGDIRLVIKNHAGRFVFVSDNAPGPHGLHSPAEMLGKTDFDINPYRLAKGYHEDDQRVLRTGQPLINRVELCFTASGMLDWVVTSKFPLRDRQGEVIGLAVTIQKHRGIAQLPVAHEGLRRVVAHVLAHLGGPLPRQRLSAILAVSPRQLQRLFLERLGMSPTEFIVRARLSRACEWLRERPLGIAAIALELGFYDQSAFTRLFRKYLGLTPSAFRRQCMGRRTED